LVEKTKTKEAIIFLNDIPKREIINFLLMCGIDLINLADSRVRMLWIDNTKRELIMFCDYFGFAD